jgi:hypothetical protein
MAKMVVVLEWDELELSGGWMNIYNLELLLYSQERTKRNLLSATLIATEEGEVVSKRGYIVEDVISELDI